jgi:excisionase family DNA binding protein
MAQKSRSKRPLTPPASAELVSIQTAAARFHVHPDTIRRRITEGRLPAYRMGTRVIRVDLRDLTGLFQAIPTAGDHETG